MICWTASVLRRAKCKAELDEAGPAPVMLEVVVDAMEEPMAPEPMETLVAGELLVAEEASACAPQASRRRAIRAGYVQDASGCECAGEGTLRRRGWTHPARARGGGPPQGVMGARVAHRRHGKGLLAGEEHNYLLGQPL